MMDELTELEGKKVEDTRSLLTPKVYEIAEAERVKGGSAKFTLEKVEGRKCNDTRTHYLSEFQDLWSDGTYELVDDD